MRATSVPAQRAAAVAGVGVAALPCYLAGGDPGLRRVLPDERIVPELWLAVRRDLRRVQRVRAVAQWLEEVAHRDAAVLRGEAASVQAW